MEVNSSYFVRACSDLSQSEQNEVKKTFAAKLDHYGVCKIRTTKICNIKDIAIICGKVIRPRHRRAVMEEVASVDFVFNVQAYKMVEDPQKCVSLCTFLHIQPKHCVPKFCIKVYKRFLRASVLFAKQQLNILYRQRRLNLKFKAAKRDFVPKGISTGIVLAECDRGMKKTEEKCGMYGI